MKENSKLTIAGCLILLAILLAMDIVGEDTEAVKALKIFPAVSEWATSTFPVNGILELTSPEDGIYKELTDGQLYELWGRVNMGTSVEVRAYEELVRRDFFNRRNGDLEVEALKILEEYKDNKLN